MDLPPKLRLSVDLLDSSFKRSTIKLRPDKATTSATANDTIELTLPGQRLVDLSSFSWCASVDIAAGTEYLPPDLQCFVRRLQVSTPNGVISEISEYGRLYHHILNWTGGTQQRKLREIYGLASVKRYFVGDTAEATAYPPADGGRLARAAWNDTPVDIKNAAAEQIVEAWEPQTMTAATKRHAATTNFLGFFQIDAELFDTSLCAPGLKVELDLNSDNVLSDSTYTLSDMYFLIDVIRFSSYAEFLRAKLMGPEQMLTYKVPRYITYNLAVPTASSTTQYQIQFVSSSMNKMLFWTYESNSNGDPGQGQYTVDYFSSVRDGITSIQVTDDAGQQHPSYKNALDKHEFAFFETLRALSVHKDPTYDCIVDNQHDYENAMWLYALNFQYDGQNQGQYSGYSSQGQNSNFSVEVTRGTADGTYTMSGFMVTLVCDSFYDIMPGQIERLRW